MKKHTIALLAAPLLSPLAALHAAHRGRAAGQVGAAEAPVGCDGKKFDGDVRVQFGNVVAETLRAFCEWEP